MQKNENNKRKKSVACFRCNKYHIKCNDARPCNNCIKSKCECKERIKEKRLKVDEINKLIQQLGYFPEILQKNGNLIFLPQQNPQNEMDSNQENPQFFNSPPNKKMENPNQVINNINSNNSTVNHKQTNNSKNVINLYNIGNNTINLNCTGNEWEKNNQQLPSTAPSKSQISVETNSIKEKSIEEKQASKINTSILLGSHLDYLNQIPHFREILQKQTTEKKEETNIQINNSQNNQKKSPEQSVTIEHTTQIPSQSLQKPTFGTSSTSFQNQTQAMRDNTFLRPNLNKLQRPINHKLQTPNNPQNATKNMRRNIPPPSQMQKMPNAPFKFQRPFPQKSAPKVMVKNATVNPSIQWNQSQPQMLQKQMQYASQPSQALKSQRAVKVVNQMRVIPKNQMKPNLRSDPLRRQNIPKNYPNKVFAPENQFSDHILPFNFESITFSSCPIDKDDFDPTDIFKEIFNKDSPPKNSFQSQSIQENNQGKNNIPSIEQTDFLDQFIFNPNEGKETELRKLREENEKLKREMELLKKEKENEKQISYYLNNQIIPLQGKNAGTMFYYFSYEEEKSFNPKKEKFVFISECLCMMIGLTPNQIIGKYNSDLSPKYSDQQIQKYIEVKKKKKSFFFYFILTFFFFFF